MNRLLAKLPRSSSGSREASASSRAARLPSDILEVSMIEAGARFSGLALVSSLICFSGASSGDFILNWTKLGLFRCFNRRKIGFPFAHVASIFRTARTSGHFWPRCPFPPPLFLGQSLPRTGEGRPGKSENRCQEPFRNQHPPERPPPFPRGSGPPH